MSSVYDFMQRDRCFFHDLIVHAALHPFQRVLTRKREPIACADVKISVPENEYEFLRGPVLRAPFVSSFEYVELLGLALQRLLVDVRYLPYQEALFRPFISIEDYKRDCHLPTCVRHSLVGTSPAHLTLRRCHERQERGFEGQFVLDHGISIHFARPAFKRSDRHRCLVIEASARPIMASPRGRK